MAFIEDKDPIVLNIKLTSKGRELLAGGNLDFKYFALGDSEIDYKFNADVKTIDSNYSAFDSRILRPADKNANIISFINRNLSGNSFNELSSVPIAAYAVENQTEPIGFFNNDLTKFNYDSNHVKQPDIIISMDSLGGDDVLRLQKSLDYGGSLLEPTVGDILLVNWGYVNSTYDEYNFNINKPLPYLFYKITEIIEGSLATDSSLSPFHVRVDRDTPKFVELGYVGKESRAMVYYNEINYSAGTITQLSPTDYLNESVLSFLENNQCPTVVFPYWNMSIIYTEEIAGVQAGDFKYTLFNTKNFGGFVSYIQNQAPSIKKMGIIHYTNSSPANVYGEGFLQNSPVLYIPTIMWHKSSETKLGITLSALGGQQLLTGLNLYYYDLADENDFIVGKVFNDLKIFIIEDQELLFAMSYKSNRSWTLPDYDIV
jgi:hypothetical protein